MDGKKIGPRIPVGDNVDDFTLVEHPLHPENFISVDREYVRVYSWADALEVEPCADEAMETVFSTASTCSLDD